MDISKRVEKIAPSGIRAFFDLVLGMKEVISLGVGEPDFVTPWTIGEMGIYSIEKGYTSYTSNKGLLKLRLQIARYLRNRFSLSYNPEEEILITVGVSEALDLAVRAILNPNEKVLIPNPGYVSYAPITILAGGIPVYLHTSARDNFKIRPQAIVEALKKNKRVKAIILNYPSNPTGVSYTKGELNKIKEAALKEDIVCISDEIYDELTYEMNHIPFSSLKGARHKTIYLNGFSKSYAMTGWRVGFACGPREIIQAMTKIHQYTMLCAPIISQMAACEALQNAHKYLDSMKREYCRRRELVVSSLNKMGLECIWPQGAFYAFPSIRKTGLDSLEFANQLLKKENVAVVPGVAFGSSGEGHIRISYSVSLQKLREALERIANFISKVR